MRTGELCVRDVVTATRDEPLREAARRMVEKHVGSLVVVDELGALSRPIGIVTDRDLVRTMAVEGLGHGRAITVGDLMSRELLVADDDQDVLEALARMRVRGVRRLPVVDQQRSLVGILTLDDIVEWLAEELTGVARLVNREQRRERERKGQ